MIFMQRAEGSPRPFKYRLLRIMKLAFFLTVVCVFQAIAEGKAQKITLNVQNTTLREVMKEIQKQQGYLFFFRGDQIATRRISAEISQVDLPDALDRILINQGLSWSIKNKTIIIRREAPPEQQTTISGKVTDQTGQPIEGVTVALKGTSVATTTDAQGRYQVRVTDDEPLLMVFSMVGYNTVEQPIANRQTLDIILTTSISDLDEVVVVGYGTQRRSDITGAISSVNMSDLEGVPIRTMDQALQGRVSGVFMSQSGSQPGAGNTIRIRGGNSITGSNEPLYVIDGVPVYVSPTDATSLNPLNSISPADIASMEVLKDASATAIYGARGGNGVILITTRRGQSGTGRINLNISTGWQQELKRLKLLNAKQFQELANEASLAEGGELLYDPSLNPYTTDWQGALFRDGAPIQDIQLSTSGGSEKSQYMLSLSYYDQQGIIKASDMDRISLRLNLDRDVNDRIKVGNSLTGSYVTTNRISSGSMLSMLTTPPDLPIFQPDGTYTQFDQQGLGFNNPVGLLHGYKNLNKVFRVLGNVYASAEIVPGLSVKTMWGLDANFMKNDTYVPQSVYTGSLVGGDADVSTNQTLTWLNENTLNYTKELGMHRIEALVGYTQQSSRYEGLGASASGFLNDNTGSYNLGLGNLEQAVLPSSQTAGWTILSWIGRVNYSFDRRYLLTLTGRYDGSSRFGSNNRWGMFPSAAFAWRAIDEDFIQDLGVFSDLKLRLSHGVTGNQDGIGNYPALDLWGAANYVLDGVLVKGITPTQIANRNLKWESTQSTDAGLEMGFFNNRLSVVADVYYKRTHDLLLNVSVPATSGFVDGTKNIGSLENKGLELTVNAEPLTGPFVWNSSFNISWNRNKVLDLGVEDEIIPAGVNTTMLKVGQPLGNFLGYISDGIFQSIEEVMQGSQPSAKPGDIRFIDFNNDGVINADDRRIMGNAQPKFYGGFINSFAYKGFELSAFLQFIYGNAIFNQNTISLEALTGQRNQTITVLDRWTPTNRDTEIPRATTTKPTTDVYDRYVEDGSYLRLKQVQLVYRLPLEKWRALRSVSLFANAQNLLTFSNYSGFDPEVNRYAGDNVRQGYDSGSYPTVRTFTFGVNIGL